MALTVPNTSHPVREPPSPPAATPGHLIDDRALAGILAVGYSTVQRLKASGLIGPTPIRIGRSTRWSYDEVQQWLRCRRPDGGLPGRTEWVRLRNHLT